MGTQRANGRHTWIPWCLLVIATSFAVTAAKAGEATYEVVHNLAGFYGESALAIGADNAYYGATDSAGAHGKGSVFRLQPDGTYEELYSFSGAPLDGERPQGLTRGLDGNLYGATMTGGASNLGTIFRVNSKGKMTLLRSFSGHVAKPHGSLLAASDGYLYGNSTLHKGAIFRVTTRGAVDVVHAFQGGAQDGEHPWGRLTEGSDGFLYGTTLRGGMYDSGTVFKMSRSDGAITLLHHFQRDGGGHDGPARGVTEGPDGWLYGVMNAEDGTEYRRGHIFRVSTDGQFEVVYDFDSPRHHGADPTAELLLGRDGYLYGTTSQWNNRGGAVTWGTVFRIGTNGALETLHTFHNDDNQGFSPNAALVEASDGEFLGSTEYGHPGAPGVIFRVVVSNDQQSRQVDSPPLRH
jgi:uncharacterized repeat protein (TIGR03803 family)